MLLNKFDYIETYLSCKTLLFILEEKMGVYTVFDNSV
jgi:hypothetical protein